MTGLASAFLEPSPSLHFDLKRKREDGSVHGVPFRCRLLKKSQTDDALRMAQEYAEKREKKGYANIYQEAQAVEILAMAICHPDKHDRSDGTSILLPMFTSSQQMRDALNTEDMAQMLSAYELTRAHYGFTDLSEEGVETLIDKLAHEMTGPYFLSHVASDEWPHLIYALARLAQSWRPLSHQTQSDSDSFSESDRLSWESGTIGSSEPPASLSSDYGESKPGMTREEALARVRAANDPRVPDPNNGA